MTEREPGESGRRNFFPAGISKHKIERIFGFRKKRRLSQVFIREDSEAARFVASLDLRGKTVLEIGAGSGRITKLLAQKAARVVAVEVDGEVLPLLRENLRPIKNVEVVHADALNCDLSYPVVVSFVPYHIAAPLLFRLLDSGFGEALLCLQKELVLRIFAQPGSADYSRLTVMAASKCDAELVFEVPKEDFEPVPKVDSALVWLRGNRKADLDTNLVSALFQHKNQNARKALLHSVSFLKKTRPQLSEARVKEFCLQHPAQTSKRARDLSLEEFAALSQAFVASFGNAGSAIAAS